MASNVILVRAIHYSAQVIERNGQKWLFLSLSAVVRTSAQHAMEQGYVLYFSKKSIFLCFKCDIKTYISPNTTYKIHIF